MVKGYLEGWTKIIVKLEKWSPLVIALEIQLFIDIFIFFLIQNRGCNLEFGLNVF